MQRRRGVAQGESGVLRGATLTSSPRSSCRILTAATRSRSPSARSSRCARRTTRSRARLRELIRSASENDVDQREGAPLDARAVRGARPRDVARGALPQPEEDFEVPLVACRLWGKVPEQSYLPELAATSHELREYADSLGAPYCGPDAPFESRDWFEGGEAASLVRVPAAAHRAHLRPAGSRQRGPAAVLRRDGHRLPHAPRGARERRHLALPAAGLRPPRRRRRDGRRTPTQRARGRSRRGAGFAASGQRHPRRRVRAAPRHAARDDADGVRRRPRRAGTGRGGGRPAGAHRAGPAPTPRDAPRGRPERPEPRPDAVVVARVLPVRH